MTKIITSGRNDMNPAAGRRLGPGRSMGIGHDQVEERFWHGHGCSCNQSDWRLVVSAGFSPAPVRPGRPDSGGAYNKTSRRIHPAFFARSPDADRASAPGSKKGYGWWPDARPESRCTVAGGAGRRGCSSGRYNSCIRSRLGGVGDIAAVAYLHRPFPGKQPAVARIARRQHAIEHIHATAHGLDQVLGVPTPIR